MQIVASFFVALTVRQLASCLPTTKIQIKNEKNECYLLFNIVLTPV